MTDLPQEEKPSPYVPLVARSGLFSGKGENVIRVVRWLEQA